MATGRESDGSDMPRRKVFPTFTPRVQYSNPVTQNIVKHPKKTRYSIYGYAAQNLSKIGLGFLFLNLFGLSQVAGGGREG